MDANSQWTGEKGGGGTPEGREARLFGRWCSASASRVTKLLLKRFAGLKARAAPDVVKLVEAMEWTIAGGGKRLRPLLALAAAEAVCGDENVAIPAALAVELIHTYSLVHDDLPDLDDDPVRRGREAVHARFGSALAILAGDALQSLAFEILSEAGEVPGGADGCAKAVKILARAAGPLGMAGGQAEDLAFEAGNPGISERSSMARRKTGEMIAASLMAGAALACLAPAGLAKLGRAGLAAGEAFQIRDDLLNIEGDPKIMGKARGSDARRGKRTLVAVMGPEAARRRLDELAAEALHLIAPLSSPKLDRLLRALVARES
jgi:geranylgeranyl pyrophosphate synthase